ncbi:hypothetical protein [Streptomyces sp. BH105]|uniref:hypothetical protein n=1 Tax=Streptomyces sp. BH105 TaxID=3410408 RepID=UPI003CE9BD2B
MELRTDKQTLDLAQEIVKAMEAHVQGGISLYPVTAQVAAYMADGAKNIPMGLIPSNPVIRREVLATARDAAIHLLWQRERHVLALDEYALAVLAETPPELPARTVRQMQTRNPLVMLSSPDLTDEDTRYYREHISIPLAAYVFGRWDDGQLLCSTDGAFDDLGVMFLGFIAEPHGMVLQTIRCTVPLGDQSASVVEAVARTVSNFHYSEDLGEEDVSRFATWLRRYLTQVLCTLALARSDESDARVYRAPVRPAGKGKKVRRQRPGGVTEFVKLGAQLGKDLRRLHEADGE